MASSVISIHAVGSIKQGEVIHAFDFGSGGIWKFYMCKVLDKFRAFASFTPQGGSEGDKAPLTQNLLNGSGWLADAPIKDTAGVLSSYACTEAEKPSLAYATSSAEIGLYADGKGGITAAPVTPQSQADLIKAALSGTGTGTGVLIDLAPVKMPFYKQTWFLIVAALAVAGGLYYKFK